MLLWEIWGFCFFGFSNSSEYGGLCLILPWICLWQLILWSVMLISPFDAAFLSYCESICPAQLSCIRWFSGGVCPSNPKIDGFYSTVGVCLHLHFVVVIVASAFWHDGVIRSHLDGILKPPWPPPLKRMLVRGLLIAFLFSSKRHLCLIPFCCVGSSLCLKLVRTMKFVSTASCNYMMQLYSTCSTFTQGIRLSIKRKVGDDMWRAMIPRIRCIILAYQSFLLFDEDLKTRECRINKAVVMKNRWLMDCIRVTKRFMIFNRTLIRTNWYQIVVLSGLVLDAIGFTSTIKEPPRDKERLKHRIGAKWYLRKYYEYMFSLASKAFLTKTHRKCYFFISFSAYGSHICLCNNLRSIVLYDFNFVTFM